jgi:competence protein ComGC
MPRVERVLPKTAFSTLELLVVLAIVVVVALLLLPALGGAKAKHAPINCHNRLRQIGLSFNTWAPDHNDRFPMHVSVTNGGTQELVPDGAAEPHFQVMSNELSTPKILVCPLDKLKTITTNFSLLQTTNLSYFVAVDAQENRPSSILTGDRNITNQLSPSHRLVVLKTNDNLGWTKALHSRKGTICFSDGSVGEFRNGTLPAASFLAATNRLAVP